jgi:hypothetical protein
VTAARLVGRFVPDPLEAPTELLDYLGGQIGADDVSHSCRRTPTGCDHHDAAAVVA